MGLLLFWEVRLRWFLEVDLLDGFCVVGFQGKILNMPVLF